MPEDIAQGEWIEMRRKGIYRLILESLHHLVIILNKDLTIVYSNDSDSSHFKSNSKSGMVGEKCYKVSHSLDKPCFHYGIVCPVRASIAEKRRLSAIHKHYTENEIVIEEIISTPLAGDGYVLQEFHSMNSLLGLHNGILPICSFCKGIRDEAGVWHPVEEYFHRQTGAEFSHSICQGCIKKHYSNLP